MTTSPLRLSRSQILAFRRRVGALDERLPPGRDSLRRAAWAGLQDSMPRAALLSIHARVAETTPETWQDPSLVQLWGPRYSAYVVAARDRGVFSLGRLPEPGRRRQLAEELAERLHEHLDGRRATYGQAGRSLGESPNRLRYAAPTGRLLIRWDGARQPVVWTVPAPELDPVAARLELARRYLHVFGPSAHAAFAAWAGIETRSAAATFERLGPELARAATPVRESWILAEDEPAFRSAAGAPAPARLLPSGDTYFLLRGEDRALLVPDVDRRRALWTPRVWPGAVLIAGDIAGTWRRAQHTITVAPWTRLSRQDRDAVEAEAVALPLPGLDRPITVRWADLEHPGT